MTVRNQSMRIAATMIGASFLAATAAVLGLVVGLLYSVDDQWPPTP